MSVRFVVGPVGSGKTTRLLSLFGAEPIGSADGFACVKDLAGYEIVRLAKPERRPFARLRGAAEDATDGSFAFGRFVFSAEGVRFGETILREALADPAIRAVYLDEIGPLELEGRCFAAVFREALASGKDVVACVREQILRDVVRAFGVGPWKAIGPKNGTVVP